MTTAGAVPATADIKGSHQLPQDGYVYLRLDRPGGPGVRYRGTISNLGQSKERVVAVWNRGFTSHENDHVNLHHKEMGEMPISSAWACMGPGHIWVRQMNTKPTVWFSRGKGLPGYGMSIWFNVTSLVWVSHCSG